MTNEEVFCFDMFGPFRTGDVAILCQRKSAHIVLVDDIGLDFVALGFKELSRPEEQILSYRPMISLLQELLDRILCFVEELAVAPQPKVRIEPVCSLQLL